MRISKPDNLKRCIVPKFKKHGIPAEVTFKSEVRSFSTVDDFQNKERYTYEWGLKNGLHRYMSEHLVSIRNIYASKCDCELMSPDGLVLLRHFDTVEDCAKFLSTTAPRVVRAHDTKSLYMGKYRVKINETMLKHLRMLRKLKSDICIKKSSKSVTA